VGVATLAVSSIVAASFGRPPFAAWAVVDRAALRQLVAFGGFVAISKLLFTVYNRLDLFFLAHWRSAGEVAIYSAATTLTYAIDLTTFSIITARMANIGRLNDSAELRRHVRATLRLCMTFAIVILPLWLFARPVIDTLYTSRYHESAAVFRVLFLGSWMTMLVHPLYLVLYARQRTRALLWADAVLIAVSCAMGPLLVPAWGVIGAATMTVAARAAGCVVILLLVGRELGWLRMAPASARS
jgi:O-antigen/teichoic acid export membrane protein